MGKVNHVDTDADKVLNVSEKDVQKHFDSLAKMGNLGPSLDDGFLRAAWSDEESQAFEYIKNEAESAGLTARYDGIGNLFIRTPARKNDKKVVQVGSHIDTVPEGGNYDGAAGIVAGLEAIKAVHSSGIMTCKSIELVIWRGEESATFNAAYKGSKGAFGKSFKGDKGDILKNEFRGKTLEQAITEQGFDPSYFREQKPTINQEYIDNIFAHIELHIEQARKLETDKISIGIITSIRGYDRYRITVAGEFDHSGATPMGTEYRKDANLAIAYMQVEIDKLGRKYAKLGNDLVQTIGEINSNHELNKQHGIYNNAITKVSGIGYFSLDIRSNNQNFKEAYVNEAKKLIKRLAKSKKVDIEILPMSSDNPTENLDEKIREIIACSCDRLSYSYQPMSSGAGHDAAIVAQQMRSDGAYVPVGMLFIPCRAGISHNKMEFAKTEDVVKGANVLVNTIYELAK
ncbi:MAG: Zn-dependent hydrolase [Nanoarchaeota archaeon]|nr:Zn-dependent hydrolase [Nanoarchaeota archaeon]